MNEEKALIYDQSLERLSQLNKAQLDSPTNHPFPYTDIERYADYVETYLKHVEELERAFNDYQGAQKDREKQGPLIKEGIEKADTFIVQLTGDKGKNGSLEYKKAKAQAIKAAIAGFNDQLEAIYVELKKMPDTLQAEIDKKIAEQNALKMSDILNFISIGVGGLSALSGLAGSFMKFYGSQTNRYRTIKEEISEDWTIQDFKIKGLEGLSREARAEWKATFKIGPEEIDLVGNKLLGLGQSGLTTAIKIELYKERQKSAKKIGEYKLKEMDKIDIEAAVLSLESEQQRLDLKMQRNAFKAFIHEFLDQFKAARTWRQKISDYFDTGEARFDALDHLSELQAEIRDLEFKVSMFKKDKRLLEEKKAALEFEPNQEAAQLALQANYRLALRAALDKVVDEARAYRIWTLEPYTLPKVPANLSVGLLRQKVHFPLWQSIEERSLKKHKPAEEDFGPRQPFRWHREDYPQAFEQLAAGEVVVLPLQLDPGNEIYQLQLTNVRVFLKGAVSTNNSPFRFTLRHPGHCAHLVRKTLFSLDLQVLDQLKAWEKMWQGVDVVVQQLTSWWPLLPSEDTSRIRPLPRNIALPDDLRKAFDDQLPLSESVTISVLVRGKVWLLTDNGRIYSIRRENNHLNVYERQPVSFYLEPRDFEGSYLVTEKDGESVPDYNYEGAIHQDVMDNWREIGYSPFTIWELQIQPDYRQLGQDGLVFNHKIDWQGLTEIQLRVSAYYRSFDTLQ